MEGGRKKRFFYLLICSEQRQSLYSENLKYWKKNH